MLPTQVGHTHLSRAFHGRTIPNSLEQTRTDSKRRRHSIPATPPLAHTQRRQQTSAWSQNTTDTRFRVSGRPRIGSATILSPSASSTSQSMAMQHRFQPSKRRRRTKTWPSNTADKLSVAESPDHGLIPTRFCPSASPTSHGLACSRRHHYAQAIAAVPPSTQPRRAGHTFATHMHKQEKDTPPTKATTPPQYRYAIE